MQCVFRVAVGRMGSDLDAAQRVEGESGGPVGEGTSDEKEGDAPPRRPREREFCLPSVKELAKQFAVEERSGSAGRRGCRRPAGEVAREAEVDYSTVPVSEIVSALQRAAAPSERDGRKGGPKDTSRAATLMEVRREGRGEVKGAVEVAGRRESGSGGGGAVRCGGKQVHSLTARSISREFREGLKSGSSWRGPQLVGREGHGGESGERSVVCCRGELSPTPSVDLKNVKKFWEEIITANVNSTKQK